MFKHKFTTQDKHSDLPKTPEEVRIYSEIKELRAQARLLRDENNDIVNQIWDIEYALNLETSEDKRHQLMQQKKMLQDEIDEKQLLPKLQALLDEIEKKEKEIFGHSDVNSNSPYSL